MTRIKVTKRGKSGTPRKYVATKPPRGRGRVAVRCETGGPKDAVVVTKAKHPEPPKDGVVVTKAKQAPQPARGRGRPSKKHRREIALHASKEAAKRRKRQGLDCPVGWKRRRGDKQLQPTPELRDIFKNFACEQTENSAAFFKLLGVKKSNGLCHGGYGATALNRLKENLGKTCPTLEDLKE